MYHRRVEFIEEGGDFIGGDEIPHTICVPLYTYGMSCDMGWGKGILLVIGRGGGTQLPV